MSNAKAAHQTANCIAGIFAAFGKMRPKLIKTIDRGKKFNCVRDLEAILGIKASRTKHHKSWQRCRNEKTNSRRLQHSRKTKRLRRIGGHDRYPISVIAKQ